MLYLEPYQSLVTYAQLKKKVERKFPVRKLKTLMITQRKKVRVRIQRGISGCLAHFIS